MEIQITFFIQLQEDTFISYDSLPYGASGIVTIKQNDTTPFSINFDTAYKFPSGSDKTMSTGLNSISVLAYYIHSSSIVGEFIACNLLKDIQ